MELHVSLVGRDDLTGEIYRQLRRAILDGRLPPGERLPPTRELARRLSVSRSTVTVAYDRLTGEGFLSGRQGAGTFVSGHVAAYASRARPAARCDRARSGTPSSPRMPSAPSRSTFATASPTPGCSRTRPGGGC
jgi:GntR family transcriptional regulator / MocR family aminotransferase